VAQTGKANNLDARERRHELSRHGVRGLGQVFSEQVQNPRVERGERFDQCGLVERPN
jgi:hypothetical protein